MTAPDALVKALRSTGYIVGDQPAAGVELSPIDVGRRTTLKPDAIWRDRSNLEVVFKYSDIRPSAADVASWHRDAWNLGLAPLLWVVCPDRVEIYNAYDRPRADPQAHLLRTFRLVDEELTRLDDYAGRLAMASGLFWSREERVRRDGRVDVQLLRDLQAVEMRLTAERLPQNAAQGLLGRSIFIRYLFDRGILTQNIMERFGSAGDLNLILRQHTSAYRLFNWVRSTFNGDLFPIADSEQKTVRDEHLALIAEMFAGTNPVSGQMSFWPYRFDVIPIELISSIYEQFAHAARGEKSEKEGLHYTPISVVNLVLDEVMRNVAPGSRVLDLTCGSGVFLVESLRRFVHLQARGKTPTRVQIRDALRNQIFGVDKNEAAIRIASFSLYLAALELDPDPQPPEALRFDPLIGRNLFVANAFKIDQTEGAKRLTEQRFDLIVGNPPWTYKGRAPKPPAAADGAARPLPPRSQDFAFVWHSLSFAHERTRFGFVMRATPFFSSADSSVSARNALISALAPVALVNLAALRDNLFPTADYPAIVLLARLSDQLDSKALPIVTVPWTSTFAQSGAFEIGPSDVRLAARKDLEAKGPILKLVAFGTPRDRLLRQRIEHEAQPLGIVLKRLELRLLTGIQTLAGDRKDASGLVGMPFLTSGHLEHRLHTRSLPKFDIRRIHRPRSRSAFRGPIVLIGEGVDEGRAAVGVSMSDVVYTRSFYGISCADVGVDTARCLAGLLASAMSSWQLILTAAEFGIHKRKLLRQDIEALLIPYASVLLSERAAPVAAAFKAISGENDFSNLDRAVFDLYGLGEDDRLVVQDGLDRAKREYVGPRREAEQPASVPQLKSYSKAFLGALNVWQSALGRRSYGAEIIAVRATSPLRVIRFFDSGSAEIRRSDVDTDINDFIAKIGDRIRVPIAEKLAAVRELRVHCDGELLIIKPAAKRFWTPATGLNDADAALGDGLESRAG